MSWNDDTITPKILLGHIQSGFESVRTEFRRELESVRTEFRRELESLKKDIATLKQDAADSRKNHKTTHTALQRLYDRRIEAVQQIDDHEERIAAIEEDIPAIKTAVGIA